MRSVPALTTVLLVAGCGVPQEPAKQAEEVESVAAEGALLAHDAAEGSTTGTFAREHARALRKALAEVRAAIEEPELSRRAGAVDRALEELAADPGDRAAAARLEDRLEELAG